MNAPTKEFLDTDIKQKMLARLKSQRDSILMGALYPGTRIDRIDRAIDILAPIQKPLARR